MKVHTVSADPLLQVLDLSKCRILAACPEQITEGGESDTAIAALIEEGERFFVVC